MKSGHLGLFGRPDHDQMGIDTRMNIGGHCLGVGLLPGPDGADNLGPTVLNLHD